MLQFSNLKLHFVTFNEPSIFPKPYQHNKKDSFEEYVG